jgi:hypothetical protein
LEIIAPPVEEALVSPEGPAVAAPFSHQFVELMEEVRGSVK